MREIFRRAFTAAACVDEIAASPPTGIISLVFTPPWRRSLKPSDGSQHLLFAIGEHAGRPPPCGADERAVLRRVLQRRAQALRFDGVHEFRRVGFDAALGRRKNAHQEFDVGRQGLRRGAARKPRATARGSFSPSVFDLLVPPRRESGRTLTRAQVELPWSQCSGRARPRRASRRRALHSGRTSVRPTSRRSFESRRCCRSSRSQTCCVDLARGPRRSDRLLAEFYRTRPSSSGGRPR